MALPAPELWKADPLSREPRTDALTKELSALCNSAAVSSRSESCGVWAEMVHSVNVGRSVVQRGVRGFRHGVGRGTRSCVCVTGRCAGPRLRPPGRADARMARRLARADRAASVSVERPAAAPTPPDRRLDPMRQPTVQFYRAAASKPEPGAGAKTTARPGQRAGATVAVKPSHPQRLAQLLHTTSYMVPGGCACGQRFLTTHVGQTLEQAARRMTR